MQVIKGISVPHRLRAPTQANSVSKGACSSKGRVGCHHVCPNLTRTIGRDPFNTMTLSMLWMCNARRIRAYDMHAGNMVIGYTSQNPIALMGARACSDMMPWTSMFSTPPSLFSDTSSFSSTTIDTGSPAICCAMPAVDAAPPPPTTGARSDCGRRPHVRCPDATRRRVHQQTYHSFLNVIVLLLAGALAKAQAGRQGVARCQELCMPMSIVLLHHLNAQYSLNPPPHPTPPVLLNTGALRFLHGGLNTPRPPSLAKLMMPDSVAMLARFMHIYPHLDHLTLRAQRVQEVVGLLGLAQLHALLRPRRLRLGRRKR